jgi:bifunctional non-homologous end joining protein LigD
MPDKPATRDFHPARVERSANAPRRSRKPSAKRLVLPKDKNAEVELEGKVVKLTNLDKPFWPELGITKRDLIQYYADVSPYLLPHLTDRAMVMKRYPNGAAGDFFFMKRAPSPRPEWIELCHIQHSSGNVIDFPMIPDYLHFDLDPVPGASFEKVIETALSLRQGLDSLKMPCYAKTTGSKGIHIYVPIERGPTQKQVWAFTKEFSHALAGQAPKLITAVYIVSKRPKGRVLVDYNQNAWGRTLASIYSVRPRAASVSTPVKWSELERGISIDDFRMDNVPARLRKLGDLWKPLLEKKGRFKLEAYL